MAGDGTGRRARDMGHLWGKRKGEGHGTPMGQKEGHETKGARGRARDKRHLRGRRKGERHEIPWGQEERRGT
jgi:hypothetical protein